MLEDCVVTLRVGGGGGGGAPDAPTGRPLSASASPAKTRDILQEWRVRRRLELARAYASAATAASLSLGGAFDLEPEARTRAGADRVLSAFGPGADVQLPARLEARLAQFARETATRSATSTSTGQSVSVLRRDLSTASVCYSPPMLYWLSYT